MAPKSKRSLQLAALAKKKLGKSNLTRQQQFEQTQRNIREEEVVDLDDEMYVGSSVNWTETCDAVAASQVPPIDTTYCTTTTTTT